MTGVPQLPNDPKLLKRLLAEHVAAIAQRDQQLAARAEQLAQRDQQLAARDAAIAQIRREAAEQMEALRQRLEAQKKAEIDAILRRFYGPRSERFDPRQLLFFGQLVEQMPIDEKAVEQEAGEKLRTRRPRSRHGRGKLPENLPRITIEHDLKDDEKKCPCCGEQRCRIGAERSEQLEYVPASFKVLVHVRHTYACPGCDQQGHSPQIETAEKPQQPIEKGLAGPGLLAYVAVSKLGDHLPLYRLEQVFARQGLEIARSTMCGWLLSMSQLVRPLVDLMIDRVKRSRSIHTDDTRVPVQAKTKCRSGRIWCYLGDESNPYDIFEYTPDRTRAGPAKFLAGYQGYLQADAYGGYDGIYARGVIEVACWAHARRKFFDAKESDGRRAAEMLAMVRELYAVEEEAQARIAKRVDQLAEQASAGAAPRDAGAPSTATASSPAVLPMQERHAIVQALRQEKSKPILAKIKAWLDKEKDLVLPRSPMAAAIGYTLNQWDALNRYVEQGYLNIDNNAAERALKRVAIGRKNWLFAGTDQFGQVAATLYTLIASARRHGLDPQAYLRSIFAKIAATPLSELEQFLPDVWKADAATEAVTQPSAAPQDASPPAAPN